MRKFFSCFSLMWPIPAKSRPVIESYGMGDVLAAEHGQKEPAELLRRR